MEFTRKRFFKKRGGEMEKITFKNNRLEFTKAVENLLALLKEWLKEGENGGISNIGLSAIEEDIAGNPGMGCYIVGRRIKFFVHIFKDYPKLQHCEGDGYEFTLYVDFPIFKIKTIEEHEKMSRGINRLLNKVRKDVEKIIEDSSLPLTKAKYRPRMFISSSLPHFLDRLHLLL